MTKGAKRQSWILVYHVLRGTGLHALAPDQRLEDRRTDSAVLKCARSARGSRKILLRSQGYDRVHF
jgi:hypothetical protein